MTINFNVTGAERKHLAQALGEMLYCEPVYAGAPTFAYQVGDYTVDKKGEVSYPDTIAPDATALIVARLREQGFNPEDYQNEVPAANENPGESGPAAFPENSPDDAPEAEPAIHPAEEPTEPTEGDISPDVAAPEALPDDTEATADDSPTDPDDPHESAGDDAEACSDSADDDSTQLTISIPREKLPDDALERLKIIVKNKETLFKRALLTDSLPIETTEEEISFPWFTLTGIDGETDAYSQFVVHLCEMAKEQTRVLDKPYDGDNDRFAMRIFMVRMGMKGTQFALARKLMMKHLTGNSGWRYGTPPKKEKTPDAPAEAPVDADKSDVPVDTDTTPAADVAYADEPVSDTDE